MVSFVLAALAGLAVTSCQAEGINRVFNNPNPDRTWTRQVAGFLSTAKSYAVVVSISDYMGENKGGYRKLDTHKDAERMKDFLLQDMGFDYVRMLTDTEVTKKNIETIMIDEIRTLVGPDDRFVFYWSGHGAQLVTKTAAFGFLPLYDSKASQFSSMVSMDDVARWNGYLQARHALFILDACLSGLAGSNVKSNPRLDQLSLPARFLMTAGTATEEAVAADRWGGSLFTDTLIKVAREHVQSSGSVVSVYRVFDEIQERVAIERQNSRWQKPLTPQLRDLQGGGGAFFFAPRLAAVTASQAPTDVGTKPIARKGLESLDEKVLDPSLYFPSVPDASNRTAAGNNSKVSSMVSQPTAVGKVPPARRELVDHCTIIDSKPSSGSFADVDEEPKPKPPPLLIDETFRLHLGASSHLLSRYTMTAGAAFAQTAFDWPGILRGSFEVVTSLVPKCNGKVLLKRGIVLNKNAMVIAVTHSYSYKTNTLLAEEGRNSLACVPFDGQFFDIKAAFDGMLADVQFDTAKLSVSDSSNDFKERRAATLQNSILGYTMLIEDTGKESKGRKIRQCTETIIHAAAGY